MLKTVTTAVVILAFFVTAADAKHRRKHRHYNPHYSIDRGTVVEHPAGCPGTAFCGCGVSVRVFGRPVRDLYLASNWFRFPRASAGPGMVAVRRGHTFYIERMLGNGVALAYDPNSGGHLTRLHPRSLAGYTVVNPHAGRYAKL